MKRTIKVRMVSGEVDESELSPENQALARKSRRYAAFTLLTFMLVTVGTILIWLLIPSLLFVAAGLALFASSWGTAFTLVCYAVAAYAVYRVFFYIVDTLSSRMRALTKEMKAAGFAVKVRDEDEPADG